MNVDNGGEQPANDTALSAEQTDNTAAENTEAVEESAEDDAGEGQQEDSQAEDEEEYDLEGQKVRIPRKLKELIAKPFQQDYTKKTMDLAESKKAVEAREKFSREHIQTVAKVTAIDDHLADIERQLEPYKAVRSWSEWRAQAYASGEQAQIDNYENHKLVHDSLKEDRDAARERRDAATRDLSEKEREWHERTNRETGERASKAQAEIAKLIPGWAPGNELDHKLAQYGTSLGFEPQALTELALHHPRLVHELNRLRQYDEAAKKQKTQQTFQQTQLLKPVTRVGGNGGSAAPRKTTDASGDKLSTAEWVRREEERLAAKRQASGRR